MASWLIWLAMGLAGRAGEAGPGTLIELMVEATLGRRMLLGTVGERQAFWSRVTSEDMEEEAVVCTEDLEVSSLDGESTGLTDSAEEDPAVGSPCLLSNCALVVA